jgi:putative ABC transport system permease protein
MVTAPGRPLDRKLLRDVWRMRIHAVAVAVVLGCGLSVYVMSLGMRASLEQTRAAYYAAYRMMDLAANLVRAPDRVAADLARIPDVAAVETRIVGYALLDMPQIDEPASARLVSLPATGRPRINDLAIVRGRWPDPAKPEEALVSEAFARALGVRVGANIAATIHGQRQVVTIVGIANAPEFVFVSAPGEIFPQPERFGVIWMGRTALARALDMNGAFNEATFRLAPDADSNRVSAAITEILSAYGSGGAYGRDRMMSDRFLSEEMKQLATMAIFLPALFLMVAAFLVNIALGRLIAKERGNIGLLKAFGYSNREIAWHYFKSALLLGVAGAFLGSLFGFLLGRNVAELYREYYNFPSLDFSVSAAVFVSSWCAAICAVGIGAIVSVWRAVRLAPAEALAPPRPTSFAGAVGRHGVLATYLDGKSRIIVRRLQRFPRRAATTVVGIAFAIALLVVAGTFPAVMNQLLNVHFSVANRQDVTLSFVTSRQAGVMLAVMRMPGVIYAEPFRADDVILRHDRREVREAIVGLPVSARLNRLIAARSVAVEPPAAGIALPRRLAERLDARPGDEIEIEQVSGKRVTARVRVSMIFDPMVSSSAYMGIDELRRLFREPGRISGAHLSLDPARQAAFNAAIKAMPALAGASFVGKAEASMRRAFDEGVGVMSYLYVVFAGVMAGGVAFSAARVTLAEQERDLATLRVLGFTRGEVSYVLVGELAVLALLAVPLGCVLGAVLGAWLMQLFQTDMYSFSFIFNPGGYAFAIAFTLGCVAGASLVVRMGIDRLDMVGVLKARD